jgi:hypothetical protein
MKSEPSRQSVAGQKRETMRRPPVDLRGGIGGSEAYIIFDLCISPLLADLSA